MNARKRLLLFIVVATITISVLSFVSRCSHSSCRSRRFDCLLLVFFKFIDRDPHWHTRRVKEAIRIRLHPDNINRDSRIEIPEAWMPTIKKHNRKTVQQRTTEGTTSRQNSEDQNAPITAHQRDINGTA